MVYDSNAQAALTWHAGRELWEQVLNAHPVPPARAQRIAREPIPVTARIAWERSGEERIDTEAVGWTVGRDPLVLVRLQDRRLRILAVWVRARDVRRRGQTLR